jgi:hypothetical protein
MNPITETQRLQFLSILAHTTYNSEEVLKKLKELHGIDLTKQQLDEYINKLKNVRGV